MLHPNTIQEILIHLSSYSMYVVFLVFLVKTIIKERKHVQHSPEYKIFGAYILVATLIEILATIFTMQGKNSLAIGHVWYPMEFALLALFMLRFVNADKKSRTFLIIVFVLIDVLAAMIILQCNTPLHKFSVDSDILESVALFSFAVYILLFNKIDRYSQTFIILLVIVYYFSTSIVLNPAKFVIPEYFYIQSGVNLICNITLALSFTSRKVL